MAREIEKAGVATVALSSCREITEQNRPPRALHVRYPYGRTLGEPGNRNQQLAVLYCAFELLFEAGQRGTIRYSNFHWKRDQFAPPDWEQFRRLEPVKEKGD